MSANPCTRWFWNDWDNDRALALCSLAAQGLWMRVLSIAARAGGYVSVNGKACSVDDIAALVGRAADEISPLLDELSARGVFSRTRDGTIYNRRMVRDEKKRKTSRKNGAKGGNPALLATSRKQTEKQLRDNPQLNGEDKAGVGGGVVPLIPLTPLPIEEDSDANASGAAAPVAPHEPDADPVKQIWDRGLAILGKKNRSLLGKYVSQYTKPVVMAAIIETEREQPVEPVGYFIECCERRRANGRDQSVAYDILARAAIEHDEREGYSGHPETPH